MIRTASCAKTFRGAFGWGYVYAALRKRGLDAPANDSSSHEERREAYGNRTQASWRSHALEERNEEFQSCPKLCWSTMSTFCYGVRHHIRWSSGWSALTRLPAARRCRLLATYSRQEVFPELWKRVHTSIQNTAGWLSLCRCGNHTERSSPLRSRKEVGSPNLVTKSKRVPTNDAGERPGPKWNLRARWEEIAVSTRPK